MHIWIFQWILDSSICCNIQMPSFSLSASLEIDLIMWSHFEFCWADSDTHPLLFASLFTVFTSPLYSCPSATKTLMNVIGERTKDVFWFFTILFEIWLPNSFLCLFLINLCLDHTLILIIGPSVNNEKTSQV